MQRYLKARLRDTIAVALLAAGWSVSANAAGLGIELNKLDGNDSGCLAYLVIDNKAGAELDSLILDFYTFDADGIIGENLAVQLAPVPAQKLTVKGVQFASSCDGIARILLNSVPACTSVGAPVEGCAASLTLGSKAAVALDQ